MTGAFVVPGTRWDAAEVLPAHGLFPGNRKTFPGVVDFIRRTVELRGAPRLHRVAKTAGTTVGW
jgi:hypothetical protein